MIPDEIIEQVRDAADLVGIVGEHVELKRTGADYRGPCPFHGGTHRNFAVVPSCLCSVPPTGVQCAAIRLERVPLQWNQRKRQTRCTPLLRMPLRC